MAASLPELIRDAQSGSLAAFSELVRRFQDMAVGFAYSRLRDRALAEDAAQEAFVAAYQALAQLREPAAFPAWFRRVVLKHVERVQRVKEPAEVAADRVSPADPLERLTERERSERVLAGVLALPEALRTSVILFYVGGHTIEEIADFVEEPVGTIKRRLHDARGKLQERMMDMVKDSLDEIKASRSDEFVRRVSELLSAVARGEKHEVEQLIAGEPAVVNAAGPHPIWGGEPHPLQVAAELGKSDMVSLLLDQGADPDVRPPAYDWSPLQLAIHNGHRETAALLMARGATVDLWSAAALADSAKVLEIVRQDPSSARKHGPNSSTALHFAASIEVAQALLAAGADPLAADCNGNPPHQTLVYYSERRDVARHLLSATGSPPNVWFLCADGDAAGVRALLDASPELIEHHSGKYDGAARLSQGAAPLHVAVLHGQLAVARLLLDRGAGVDFRTKDGQTALHLAAGEGHVALVELLLDRGADVAAVEAQHGATALDWAVFHRERLGGPEGCLAVAEILRARMASAASG